MGARSSEHVSGDRMQAFLDGALPTGERTRVEEHLDACARCSAELDGWRVLFEDLAAMAPHGPRRGFQERVMAQIELPARAPLWNRVGERLLRRIRRFGSSSPQRHPATDRLLDFLDGGLATRQEVRLRAHLEDCSVCASDIDAWRTVYTQLGGLRSLSPHDGFRDRVMAAVRIPTPTAAPAAATPRVAAGAAGWRRALAPASRLVPRTRRAWAALSGVALTPAVAIGLVMYAVLSHPTVTPQALASFAIWKLTELFATGWAVLVPVVLDTVQSLGVDSVVRALFDAPLMLAGGAAAYSVVSVLALRVLYTNLLNRRRYARPSHL